jgi:catechol 2,3-dioxygenase-like lactoylglutathione lyase family enzyme
MLTTSRATTMLPVTDADRAGRFYTETFGLREWGVTGDGTRLFVIGGGDALGLRVAEPGAQSTYTALSFEVEDIRAEIRELEGRGVVFEDYDLPGLKTVDHIATMGEEKATWFRDTESNILCRTRAGMPARCAVQGGCQGCATTRFD